MSMSCQAVHSWLSCCHCCCHLHLLLPTVLPSAGDLRLSWLQLPGRLEPQEPLPNGACWRDTLQHPLLQCKGSCCCSWLSAAANIVLQPPLSEHLLILVITTVSECVSNSQPAQQVFRGICCKREKHKTSIGF
jgi:hypothetical protein